MALDVDMDMDQARLAVYFAPDETSGLGQFGARWLERSGEVMGDLPPSPVEGLETPHYHQVIETPRHYGFHGTLKAPFLLHPHRDLQQVDVALDELSATTPLFTLPPLGLQGIDHFIALVADAAAPSEPSESSEPTEPLAELHNLHRRLTVTLDGLRAPLTAFDRRRFMARGLSERQAHHLVQYGYPYVMADFRFHLTLTGTLESQEQETLFPLLDRLSRAVRKAHVSFSHIALFSQKNRQSPFLLLKKYPLRG